LFSGIREFEIARVLEEILSKEAYDRAGGSENELASIIAAVYKSTSSTRTDLRLLFVRRFASKTRGA
jgi:hypothetical protein